MGVITGIGGGVLRDLLCRATDGPHATRAVHDADHHRRRVVPLSFETTQGCAPLQVSLLAIAVITIVRVLRDPLAAGRSPTGSPIGPRSNTESCRAVTAPVTTLRFGSPRSGTGGIMLKSRWVLLTALVSPLAMAAPPIAPE